MTPPAGRRKTDILDMLARMLCDNRAARVTTAALAARLNISEAALYRHFRSKAEMFDDLILRMETGLHEDLEHIARVEPQPVEVVRKQVHALLLFPERHPGLSRILTGHALVHEEFRLHQQVGALIAKLELQLDASVQACPPHAQKEGALAPLLMTWIRGRWLRYVQSDWSERPTDGAAAQLSLLMPSEQTGHPGSR